MYDVLKALANHAQRRPDDMAFFHKGHSLCFKDLYRLVSGTAKSLEGLPQIIGLQAPNSLEWVVTDLALMASGRTVVPIPTFFSKTQVEHIIRDAAIDHVITVPEIIAGDDPLDIQIAGKKIIYTSGTTGQPKGVVHGARQINFITQALIAAAGVSKEDRHLSALPFSLLLEQICGIYIPVTVGFPALIVDDSGSLIQLSEKFRPTTSVLVPELLAGWMAGLKTLNKKAPESLRFVAVGGAPVPQSLGDEAWALGIPAHEGYGLSECCSVVAVNRPGQRVPGTVGKPLAEANVTIENGEITVASPAVMDGYLGGHTVQNSPWHTGDLGAFDDNGNLIVYGRKDTVIVTNAGRNISPEWIEAMITAHPAFASCEITGHGKPFLTAVVTLSETGKDLPPEEIDDLIEGLTSSAPEYARPQEWLVKKQPEQLYSGGQLRDFF